MQTIGTISVLVGLVVALVANSIGNYEMSTTYDTAYVVLNWLAALFVVAGLGISILGRQRSRGPV